MNQCLRDANVNMLIQYDQELDFTDINMDMHTDGMIQTVIDECVISEHLYKLHEQQMMERRDPGHSVWVERN